MISNLYSWQESALEIWTDNSCRGIISATTGSGKTYLAISAIRRLFNISSNLKIIVLVPTIALLKQWKQEIQSTLDINPELIGCLGSRYHDELRDKKILICVANSALKFLKEQINSDKSQPDLFLIADECHRYGSLRFSSLLKFPYKYTLGLSATPERESDYGFEEYLRPYIGRVIFEYTYDQAINDGVISPFEIINYGIKLRGKEKDDYRRISEKIKDLRTILEAKYPSIRYMKGKYIAELKKRESSDQQVKQFLELSIERKRMLYNSDSRIDCLLDIMQEHPGKKCMIFHEDVNSLNKINEVLLEHRYDTEIQHYKKKGNFDSFKRSDKKVFLSVRMFSEGVDLPDVDLGIIVASSSSVRQKIQTMGRIVRKSKTKDIARIFNIFIKDTADELIFRKINWDNIVGENRMKTLSWPEKTDIKLDQIKQNKYRSEEEETIRINEGRLQIGDVYTAKLSGKKFSFDSEWNLFRKYRGKREYASNQHELKPLAEMVQTIKHRGGSFFINDKGHVLVKDQTFKLIFVGRFDINKIVFYD